VAGEAEAEAPPHQSTTPQCPGLVSEVDASWIFPGCGESGMKICGVWRCFLFLKRSLTLLKG